MLDEGITRSVRTPPSRRGPLPFWAAALVAPVAAYLLGWIVDEALLFMRASRFDAWYGPVWPQPPVVGVHPSPSAWVVVAAVSIALSARLVRDRRRACATLAAALVAPLAFGTVRHALAWRDAARVTADLALVPACTEVGADGGHVFIGGAYYRLDASRALVLTDAAARMSEDGPKPILLLRVGPGEADGLAGHSHASSIADARCAREALVVGGRPRLVARMETTLLWGELSLSDPDPAELRAIFAALVAPR
jgi:hypothetical protein